MFNTWLSEILPSSVGVLMSGVNTPTVANFKPPNHIVNGELEREEHVDFKGWWELAAPHH